MGIICVSRTLGYKWERLTVDYVIHRKSVWRQWGLKDSNAVRPAQRQEVEGC